MASSMTRAAGPFPYAPGLYNYRTEMALQEEFLTGSTSSTTLGSLGLVYAGGTATVVAAEANHPGIVQRATGASAGTFAYTILGAVNQGLLPAGTMETAWAFRLNTNDADTAVRIGFQNSLSVAPTAGQYLEKAGADTNWFAVTQHASTPTRTDTTLAVDTGWHTIRVARIGSSHVVYTFDHVTVAVIASTVTSTACYCCAQITNGAANASKTIDLDYAELILPLTR